MRSSCSKRYAEDEEGKKWKRIMNWDPNWNVKTIRWRKTVRAFIHRWIGCLCIQDTDTENGKKTNDVWSNLLNSSSHDDRHKTIQTEPRMKKKIEHETELLENEKNKITRLLFITLFGFWIFCLISTEKSCCCCWFCR